MSGSAQIILASASPRRRELLTQVGVTAIVQAVDIDESRKPNEPVNDYVERLAMEKAQCGFDTIKNEIIKQIVFEEQAQLIDFKQHLQKMPYDAVLEVFENSVEEGKYSEDFKTKFEILTQVNKYLRPGTIVSTGTSGLSINSLSAIPTLIPGASPPFVLEL